MSYRFSNDRMLSMGAGLLLDYGLRQIGLREKDAMIHYDTGKKPALAGGQVEFSLSHAGDYALAAFSVMPVGADIEKNADGGVRRQESLGLAERFFTEGECAYISRHDESEQAEAFMRLWRLKESFSKMFGFGLTLPLDGYEILPSDGVGETKIETPRLRILTEEVAEEIRNAHKDAAAEGKSSVGEEIFKVYSGAGVTSYAAQVNKAHMDSAYYFYEFTLPGYGAAVCGMEDAFAAPVDVTEVVL
ncbi:MAG: 4'-phosphopantetheinyl transferase superfamily protein [Clostridiales Family XIII bacterium]|nr:4'-phosphopantetheinyl transferase superfamily protein [Clostridiales Family XIII bacterium]